MIQSISLCDHGKMSCVAKPKESFYPKTELQSRLKCPTIMACFSCRCDPELLVTSQVQMILSNGVGSPQSIMSSCDQCALYIFKLFRLHSTVCDCISRIIKRMPAFFAPWCIVLYSTPPCLSHLFFLWRYVHQSWDLTHFFQLLKAIRGFSAWRKITAICPISKSSWKSMSVKLMHFSPTVFMVMAFIQNRLVQNFPFVIM